MRNIVGQQRAQVIQHVATHERGVWPAMVQRLLSLTAAPGTDAADALGIAITHAHAGASLAALAALAKATLLERRQHAQYRRGRAY